MADSRVTFDLIARDHASRTVGQVGDSVDRLTKRITHLAGAFGGAFVLQQAGEYALKMADQFEASRARVENITRNLGGSFDAISGQVQSLDDRLAAFGFTNADVEGSFASLESVTKSTGQAFKDAALAADIARGRGISLAESTSILMRVETGHVAMLSRLGIATKDANGNLLTQGQALDMLRAKYRGAAGEFSKTAAGEQAALRAQLGNTASKIGVALLPAFVDLARVLQKDVLPPVKTAAEFFDRNRKTIEPLVGALLKLALAYKAVKLASRLGSALGLAGRSLATGGAEGAGALSAWSLSRPLPVFVVNSHGGGLPPVVGGAAKDVEVAGEDAGALAKAKSILGRAMPLVSRVFVAGIIAQTSYSLGKSLINTVSAGPDSAPANAQAALFKQAQTPKGQVQLQANLAKLQQIAAREQSGLSGKASQTVLDEIRWTKAALDAARAQARLAAATAKSTAKIVDQAKALAHDQARSIALSQAQDDMTSAMRAMGQSASENGKALAGNSAAAVSNRDALRGAVSQAQSYLQTLKDQHVSQAKVAATAVALAGAIDRSASSTFGNRKQVVALLRQLHFMPGQIQAALSSTQSLAYNLGVDIMANLASGIDVESSVVINHAAYVAGQTTKAMRLAAGLDAQPGQYGSQTIDPKASKQAKNFGTNIAKQVTSTYVPTVSAGIGSGTAKAVDNAFANAKSRMKSEFAQIKQALASEKQTLISTFSSLDLSPTTDSLGASGPPKSLLSQIKANARQANTFTHLYFRLAKAGASGTVLAMFRDLGPDGIPTMREWLNHPKELRQANRAERHTAHDAGRIAARDTQDVYGKAIHRDLQHLPHKLAKEFAHDLRKIHIHVSLSEVDRKNGRKVKASP